jgi:BetI-type transcriptional repressor, C-terminal
LQYHFRSIEEPLTATVQFLMDLHLNQLVDLSKQQATTPEDRLRNLIEFSLAQIRQPRTARVAFEAWAVAQHNERARKIPRAVYEIYRELFAQAIANGFTCSSVKILAKCPFRADSASAGANSASLRLVSGVIDQDRKARFAAWTASSN